MIGAASVVIGAGLDTFVGEPPNRFHPVAWLGRVIETLDRDWPAPRLAGVAVAFAVVALAAVGAGGLTWIATTIAPAIGGLVAGVVLWLSVSRRYLLHVARTRLDQPSADLAALVGRSTTDLSPGQRRSAIAESLAENLADGLVAPLAGFLLGAIHSPWAAAAGTAALTAIDALDATIGYPDRPLGWASARTDDLTAALPARLAAVSIALVARDPGAVWRARSTARRPASPNAGWPMATLAAVLGVTFEKPGAYRVGEGTLPTHQDVERAITIVDRAAWLAVVVTAGLAAIAPIIGRGVLAGVTAGGGLG